MNGLNMIDYMTASNSELKEEFKRLAKLSGDAIFGTKKNSFIYQKS